MIPSAANSDYPKFVADQVLTSDNLNDLFGYLDEQGRMTRTNLSGIGIVCGLQVKCAADGTSITITKGVGVTSSGYLVSVPEVKYTKRTTGIFNAVNCDYYSKFVNIAAKTQKFDLWELKQEAESEGTTALTNKFITDGTKIVLIFVELLEENNKNCDPNSCDDKGVTATVNFRPLLVEQANVADLLAGAGAGNNSWLSLPEMTMKRFDVTANPLFECLNFFKGYQKILSAAFLSQTEKALGKAYDVLKPMLADEFPSNPFSTLASDFKFLNDGSITSDQLINMQYYYDLFSDIFLAYDEFRNKGIEVIGMCCPDDIFPRHLLLDLAKPDLTTDTSAFRHYFIPSPILCDQYKTVSRLKILFRKLVLLVQKFAVPAPNIKGTNKIEDASIRITPSILAGVPFSKKSIPYYYAINNAADSLLKNWSPQKLLEGKTNRNLSYQAIKYNFLDDDIRQPLLYDLELYNFLRIEGHIGKPYQHVVKNITALRDKNRLPFDIVTLNADISSISTFIKNLGQLMTAGNTTAQATLENLMGTSCNFHDLELLYDSIMAELTGKLSNEMKFFYDLKRDAKRQPLPAPNSNVPLVPLLVKTDATYRFTSNSIGHEFEQFYALIKNQAFIPMNVFFQSFGQDGNTDVMDFVFKAVLYYVEMLYETVTTSLSNFNFIAFNTRYYTLVQVVRYIKLLNRINNELFPLSEEENDHLDAILSISADGRMIQLYLEFLRRILKVKIMQQAGYYVRTNPGIQHKAGVPMGGTFIIIYHEEDKAIATTGGFTAGTAAVAAVKGGIKDAGSLTISSLDIKRKVAFAGEIKLADTASTREHLELLSAAVGEKVFIAGESVIAGLKRTIPERSVKVESAAVLAGDGKESAVVTVPEITVAAAESKVADPVLAYLTEAGTYLKNRKADALDEAIDDFNNGIVIADFYLPYTCCSDCSPVQMIVMGESDKPNQPPVARPGDNVSIQLPVNSVILDGSNSSDPDGTIKTYLWEKESGPDASIESPSESKTVVSKLTEGVYVFKLTVTDNAGASDTATVTVTVLNRTNVPPVAKATANPPTVVLNANNSGITELSGKDSFDPDGSIKSFSWSLSSGQTAGAAIKNPDKEVTSVSFSLPGTYVFKLVVTDDKGATDTTTVSVFVTVKENQPPVAVAKAEPGTVVLSANGVGISLLDASSSSDPDGTIVSFLWELVTTIPAVIKDPSKSKTEVQFNKPGVYEFKLTVKDDKGATASDTIKITVTTAPNQPPVAKASANPSTVFILPTTGSGRTTLSSSGSTDPDGDPITFSWSLSSGPAGGAVIKNPNAADTDVNFITAGSYVFKLIVTDSKGSTGTASVTVNVQQQQNQPPVANATATPEAVNIFPGQAGIALLDSSGSKDPDGQIVASSWMLVSTAPGAVIETPNAPKTNVRFTQAGSFTFRLTVTDNGGKTAETTITVRASIQQGVEVTKACAPLNNIIADFGKLSSADTPANFKAFGVTYVDAREIAAFYKLMDASAVATMPLSKQIEFFVEQKTETTLVTWIGNLRAMVVENSEQRLLALLMLNVHAELAYFISCIQKEDINAATVKMARPLSILGTVIKVSSAGAGNFNVKQKAAFTALAQTAIEERGRIKNNNEETVKVAYTKIVDAVIGLF